ncbi:MAG: hypothetical protein O7F73_11990 [Gammaproteobacteria bacterium]|nr:hypothetical protein [Gammaproteobacteria bacterium]
MSYLREFPGANMQDFLYGTDVETPGLFVDVGRSILISQSQLTHKDREMMAAYCLSLNNALQPINVHSRNFSLLGGERWLIQDLVRDPGYQSIDERFRPLLCIIRKATEKADSVTRADVEAAYEAGWNGHTIHLVATLTGFFNQMARWVNILGMKYDEEEVQGSSEFLTTTGYQRDFDPESGEAPENPSLTDEEYKQKFPDYMSTTFSMGEQSLIQTS